MLCHVKHMCAVLRLSVLQLICLILICLLQFPFFTHTAHAQTIYNEPYGMIQLADIPTPAQRMELSNAGIDLGDYANHLTWEAKFNSPIDADQFDLIISIDELEPARKRSPLFPAPTDEINFSYEEIEVLVMLWNSDMSDDLAQYGTIIDVNQVYTTLLIDEQNVTVLSDDPNVKWVEPAGELVPMSDNTREQNAKNLSLAPLAEKIISLSNSQSLLDAGLTGEGSKVGVFESGMIAPHPIFDGRLSVTGTYTVYYSGLTPDENATLFESMKDDSHATAVAGVAALVADELYVSSYHNSQIDPILTGDVDVTIQSTGLFDYGTCIGAGNYTLRSYAYDINTNPAFVAVGNTNSAGCFTGDIDGRYGTLPEGFQSAKNVITVGGIEDDGEIIFFSSRGPTQDGRIAPTFVLPGRDIRTVCSANEYCTDLGTSFSGPGLAGISTLITEEYSKTYGTALSAADLKVLFATTATDLGNRGPDYQYGFGLINTQSITSTFPNLSSGSVDHDDTETITINVTESLASQELNIVLAWHDKRSSSGTFPDFTAGDLSQALTTTIALVNDLDLTVTAPDGSIHHPYLLDPQNPSVSATTGVDDLNVIEQIIIESPQVGDWIVTVNGAAVPKGPQSYSIGYAIRDIVGEVPQTQIPLHIGLASSLIQQSNLLLLLPILLATLTVGVAGVNRQNYR